MNNVTGLVIVVNGIVLLAFITAAWDLCRRDKIRFGAGKATAAEPTPQESGRAVTGP